jgi:hypothetical protein
MGDTRFPDGIDLGSEAGAASTLKRGGTAINLVVNPLEYASASKKVVAGTVVVPTGGSGTAFVPSGLATIDYVVASPYSTVETVAGFAGVAASHSGGTITLRGISGAGTASTASGTATWAAYGAA